MQSIARCGVSICVGLTLLHQWAFPLEQGNFKPNNVLFTNIGKTGQITGFATLIVNLNFTMFTEVYGELHDQVKAYYEIQQSPYEDQHWKTHSTGLRQFYLLKVAHDKLQTLLKLLAADDVPLDSLDVYNPYQTVVNEMLFNQSAPSTVAPIVERISTAINDRIADGTITGRKKRNIASGVTQGLTKLVGFGLGLLTQEDANKLYFTKKIHEGLKMIERFPSTKLSIFKSINYIKKIAQKHLDTIKTDSSSQPKQDLLEKSDEVIKYQISLYHKVINIALDMLKSLREKKLPIEIFNHDSLKMAYTNLISKIRNNGYRPLETDYSSIFQDQTLTYVQRNDRNVIVTFTMIPILKGNMMDIYHYAPTPLYLHASLTANVKAAENEFVAIDKMGTLVKEYTSSDIQSCTKKDKVYHCPNNQIMNKDKYTSCLYNIFDHNLPKILETCKVTLNKAVSQAVQVSGNTFRLLAPNRTQLTINCLRPRVFYIQGIYLLNLTRDCTQAYTNSHMFNYNHKSTIYNEIISLTFNSDMKDWFGTKSISEVTSVMEQLAKDYHLPVPYHELIKRIDENHYKFLLDIKQYSHDSVFILFLLYSGWKICCYVYDYLCKKRPYRRPPKKTQNHSYKKGKQDPILKDTSVVRQIPRYNFKIVSDPIETL